MSRAKPVATRIACVAAVAFYLIARPDHYAYGSLGAGLLIFGLLPALGVYLDWLRLERPSFDDGFFGAATLGGAFAVGLAPSLATAVWHPTLLVVALAFAFRRQVVTGRIVAADRSALTLELDSGRGRVRFDREAHEELGDRSSLELAPGAPLALVTSLHAASRGSGPFRSASVLLPGRVRDVATSLAELSARRRSQLRVAMGLVLLSALLGWGAASLDLTLAGSPCLPAA